MRVDHSDALAVAAGRWFEELDDRGVFITDERLIVRRWNQWLGAQTGRSAEDVVGQSLFAIYPTLVERGVDAYYRDVLAGEVRILSERFHRFLLPITRNFHGAGLTEMAQSARIAPLMNGDAVIGTITLIEDVTERVIAERELRNQIAASEQARRLAEEASRLKDEFLATLSHEIRTPLNAVIGWTRILRTQPSARSRAHALEVIERNAISQMRLVEDLLDMARIISGKLRLKIDAVSVAEIAQAAVDVIAPGAAREAGGGRGRHRARPADGQRRSRAAPAGGLEPDVERGEIHGDRRDDPAGGCACGPGRPPDRARHRTGHRTGLPAVRVRSVPPGGRVREPAPRRAGAGARTGAPDRRAPRRRGRRRQRRGEARVDLLGHAARGQRRRGGASAAA